jgi:hypothetical protein
MSALQLTQTSSVSSYLSHVAQIGPGQLSDYKGIYRTLV